MSDTAKDAAGATEWDPREELCACGAKVGLHILIRVATNQDGLQTQIQAKRLDNGPLTEDGDEMLFAICPAAVLRMPKKAPTPGEKKIVIPDSSIRPVRND